MKSLRFQSVFLALILLPVAGAFASAESHKASFSVSAPVQVAGTELPAGDYTAKWEGNGPTTQVKIMSQGKLVASVPAQVVSLQEKASGDAADVHTSGDGVRTLTGIEVGGKTFALQIGGAGSGDAAVGSN